MGFEIGKYYKTSSGYLSKINERTHLSKENKSFLMDRNPKRLVRIIETMHISSGKKACRLEFYGYPIQDIYFSEPETETCLVEASNLIQEEMEI